MPIENDLYSVIDDVTVALRHALPDVRGSHDDGIDYDYESDFDCEVDYGYNYDYGHDEEYTIEAREYASLLPDDYNHITRSQRCMDHNYRDDESEFWADVQDEAIKSDGPVSWYGNIYSDEQDERSKRV